jgi:hypothetical protein
VPPGNTMRWRGVLLVTISIMFLASFLWRMPWLGKLPDTDPHLNADMITALGVRNVNEWLDARSEHLFSRYVVQILPYSVEVGDTIWRMREIAYFPLTWFPLYAAARLTGQPATVEGAQLLNLLCHFLVALAIAWAVFEVLTPRWPSSAAFVLACSASALEIFLPGPAFYHLYTYFPDMSVLPAVVWTIFLELMRGHPGVRQSPVMVRVVRYAQYLLMFSGVLLEWLFIPLTATILLKRILLGEYGWRVRTVVRGTVETLLPGTIGMSVFFAYWVWNKALYEIYLKFIIHTGTHGHGPDVALYFPVFWGQHVPWAIGGYAPAFLWSLLGIGILGFLFLTIQQRDPGKAMDPDTSKPLTALFARDRKHL